jgi:hypothetical protein
MNDYIAKPVKQEQLIKMIKRFTPFVQSVAKEDIITETQIKKSFQYIRINYMKEVSAGNKKYEINVTQKFLNAVPLAIHDLKDALNEGNFEKMKHVAHNLKTTVSVMGLNELLNPFLDEIEEGSTDSHKLSETVNKLTVLCIEALKEAQEFQATLS